MRDSFASYDELDINAAADDSQARRARSRWIRRRRDHRRGRSARRDGRSALPFASLGGAAEVKASSDARVAKFLADGAALLDEGDFEGAKEELDKATALAEKDPAVLTALARLETLRADVSWLKLRLLDPSSTDSGAGHVPRARAAGGQGARGGRPRVRRIAGRSHGAARTHRCPAAEWGRRQSARMDRAAQLERQRSGQCLRLGGAGPGRTVACVAFGHRIGCARRLQPNAIRAGLARR